MTLHASDMSRLWADSARMARGNPGRWLSDALQCIRTTGDGAAAVMLLQKLRQYANRHEEQRSIDAVVKWIERRLHTRPRVTASRLMLELGWLRRMSVIRTAARRDDG